MGANRASSKNSHQTSRPLLERINAFAAGIDCGSERHYVAVAPDLDSEPVRSCRSYTPDLHQLADWLASCGITSVAMESTGVYWIPLFDILEARGFQVILTSAHDLKSVPGRKSDVLDCQWLQELHSVGLLRGSFRPDAEIVALRAYMRHRATLVASAATHVHRMQKALVQMNVQLHVVLSDITGGTGMRILRDIVAGVTDPNALAAHRDRRCKAPVKEIVAALTGSYRPEHIFALRQNLESYDACQAQIAACDAEVEALIENLASKLETPAAPLPDPKTKQKRGTNEPAFDVRGVLYQLTGVDLTQIDGIGPHTALQLISEIGTDMSRWPSEKHFVAWLGLSPNNRMSGGRILSSRTTPSANRAATLFRLSAMVLGRTDTALGANYRRLAFRIGKPKAITAIARKLAILVHRVLRGDIAYQDPGAAAYDLMHRASALRRLRNRATKLGFGLVDLETGEVVTNAVS